MPAPALAERMRGFVGHAAGLLHLPRRIATSTLFFDERLATTENFSDFQKAQFLRRGVINLIDKIGPLFDHYKTGAKHAELRIDPGEIERSSLPPQIKDALPRGRIISLILYADARNDQRDPNRTFGSIFVGAKGRESGIGVNVEYNIDGKSHYGLIRTDILPDRITGVNPYYWHSYHSGFTVARELIRFAHLMILTRTQPLASTPPAA